MGGGGRGLSALFLEDHGFCCGINMSKDSLKTMQYIMDFDAPNPKVKYIVRFIGS